MDILNLGAGNRPVQPVDGGIVVNHDLMLDQARPFVTVAHDLNIIPWPWPDASFDLIVACAVLEHLRRNLAESLAECWRILRPAGILYVKLPYWKSENSYTDATHYWVFGLSIFEQFDPDTERGREYVFYGWPQWKIVQAAKLNDAKTSFAAKLQVRK
ncbi:MAG TPA: methyltransferase domain-containing protein [Anaerolineae bacterium]|nr:methyltransferase domain-containing protein [Anaerolineae bacterium]